MAVTHYFVVKYVGNTSVSCRCLLNFVNRSLSCFFVVVFFHLFIFLLVYLLGGGGIFFIFLSGGSCPQTNIPFYQNGRVSPPLQFAETMFTLADHIQKSVFKKRNLYNVLPMKKRKR